MTRPTRHPTAPLFDLLLGLAAAAEEPATRPTTTPGTTNSVPKDTPWNVDKPPGHETARQVAIDVTEGTWMSVDVSPDGSTLVFDLLGDLYTLPIDGG